MQKSTPKITSGYSALMLALGVNPVASAPVRVAANRPYPSVADQIKKSPAQLTSSWQPNGGIQWQFK